MSTLRTRQTTQVSQFYNTHNYFICNTLSIQPSSLFLIQMDIVHCIHIVYFDSCETYILESFLQAGNIRVITNSHKINASGLTKKIIYSPQGSGGKYLEILNHHFPELIVQEHHFIIEEINYVEICEELNRSVTLLCLQISQHAFSEHKSWNSFCLKENNLKQRNINTAILLLVIQPSSFHRCFELFLISEINADQFEVRSQ